MFAGTDRAGDREIEEADIAPPLADPEAGDRKTRWPRSSTPEPGRRAWISPARPARMGGRLVLSSAAFSLETPDVNDFVETAGEELAPSGVKMIERMGRGGRRC